MSTNDVIRKEVRRELSDLEKVMEEYRRAGKNVEFRDLIGNDGRLLTTNLQLLEDAVRYTKDLSDKSDVKSHYKAQAALLLWGRIYCEKYLAKRFNPQDINAQEAIINGSLDGVLDCYERLRKNLNCLFTLPEEERRANLARMGSVRNYMLILATRKSATEFNKMHKSVKISRERAEQYEKQGIPVYEKNGQYSTARFVPETFTGEDNNKTYDNPEVVEAVVNDVEHEAQKLMDDAAIRQGVRKMVDSLYQSGEISDLEMEYIQDVLMGGQMESKKFKEWQEKGIEGLPKSIYRFGDAVRIKVQKGLHAPEWSFLSDLTNRRM